MALQKNITAAAFGQEIQIADCYIRVSRLDGEKTSLNFSVDYLNGAAFVKREVFQFCPSVDNDAPNFIKQAYEYLKTLPEFADAVDC